VENKILCSMSKSIVNFLVGSMYKMNFMGVLHRFAYVNLGYLRVKKAVKRKMFVRM
jgi:hypothetical protein